MTLDPWLAHAQALIGCDGHNASLIAIDKLDGLIEKTGQSVFRPFFHETRAKYARAFGGEWNYETEIETACHLFRELGAEGHVERIVATAS